tara:strand:+ start:96 stop:536 length:441 start_codon:yes stop_codon:yes gene_type:complete
MKKKKDRITPLITLALSVVFIGALIYQTLPEEKTNEIISRDSFEESIETELAKNSYVDELPVDDVWIDETEINNEQTSFDEAFAVARAELGKGNTFIWNGKEYTTDLVEEIQNEYLLADSTLKTKNDSGKNHIVEVPFTSQVTTIK